MKVFIANFGRENYEWPACLKRHTIATMNAEAVQPFWESGDRAAYIEYCMQYIPTAAGILPTRSVASRWYNLMTTIARSSGDLWIHREKQQLWWTISREDPPTFEPRIEPVNDGRRVVVCHKPTDPWSNANKNGNRLDWRLLHPRACEFLFTEGTLQMLSEDNAAYAFSLIDGRDLVRWHSRPDWQAKADRSRQRKSAGKIFNAKERAITIMAMTVMQTVAGSNGQQVLRNVKNKELHFSNQQELEDYVRKLVDAQEGQCAVTGMRLQFNGEHDDEEMLCSLDRIRSDGHYEAGNLQIVCRFINRWKSDSEDADFRRLIGLVRSTDGP